MVNHAAYLTVSIACRVKDNSKRSRHSKGPRTQGSKDSNDGVLGPRCSNLNGNWGKNPNLWVPGPLAQTLGNASVSRSPVGARLLVQALEAWGPVDDRKVKVLVAK